MSALQLQISVRAEGFSCCIPLVLIASLILSWLTGCQSIWFNASRCPNFLGSMCSHLYCVVRMGEHLQVFSVLSKWHGVCGSVWENRSRNNLWHVHLKDIPILLVGLLVPRKHSFRLKSLGWSVACFEKLAGLFQSPVKVNGHLHCILLWGGVWYFLAEAVWIIPFLCVFSASAWIKVEQLKPYHAHKEEMIKINKGKRFQQAVDAVEEFLRRAKGKDQVRDSMILDLCQCQTNYFCIVTNRLNITQTQNSILMKCQ